MEETVKVKLCASKVPQYIYGAAVCSKGHIQIFFMIL